MSPRNPWWPNAIGTPGGGVTGTTTGTANVPRLTGEATPPSAAPANFEPTGLLALLSGFFRRLFGGRLFRGCLLGRCFLRCLLRGGGLRGGFLGCLFRGCFFRGCFFGGGLRGCLLRSGFLGGYFFRSGFFGCRFLGRGFFRSGLLRGRWRSRGLLSGLLLHSSGSGRRLGHDCHHRNDDGLRHGEDLFVVLVSVVADVVTDVEGVLFVEIVHIVDRKSILSHSVCLPVMYRAVKTGFDYRRVAAPAKT